MQKDKLISTAKRHEKKNFKSTHFRRAYRTYCNNIELVKPEEFKTIVSGKENNIVRIDTVKTNKNETEKVNSFLKNVVNTHSRTNGTD